MRDDAGIGSSPRETRSHPKDVVRLFRSLSNGTRFRILSLLRLGEWCVDDVASIIGVNQPRASFHLGHLHRSGLTETRARGRQTLYCLAPAATGLHETLLRCLTAFELLPEVVGDAQRARELVESRSPLADLGR